LINVSPVACHSHNDYWRAQPLLTALSNGCISVEADVWLHDDSKLLVGHSQASLTSERTLSSLYVLPILQYLRNGRNSQARLLNQDTAKPNGIFQADPSQSLVLLIDFKSDGAALWPRVSAELEPLRQANLLTHYNGTAIVEGPVTIVVSGNAPLSSVGGQGARRDMFYDAPLRSMTSMVTNSTHAPDFNPSNSYYASANFKDTIGHVFRSKLSQPQIDLIRTQIQNAHARGLKARYWGVPTWPRGIRNYIWRVLVREGVDVLSVDNVEEVVHDNWGPRKGGCMDERWW
jgi:glycerophosphoryl diester phosphodiesterase